MTKQKGIIAGISSNYYSGSEGHPHEYLNDNGWKSILLTQDYLDDGSEIKSDIYYVKKMLLNDDFYSTSFFQRVINKLNRPFIWKNFNKWCEKHINENKVQVIHAHFGYTGVRMLPLIKKTKLPMVVTIYGVDGSQMLKEPTWIKGYKEMFDYTSYIIVLCEEVKKRLIKIGCAPEKIIIWQIPIDLKAYNYLARTPKETTKFIIAARFVAKKGYEYLFKAFKQLLNDGRNVELTIIGYGDKTLIEKQIVEAGIESKTELIDTSLKSGFPTFFNQKLSESDIFVLPSISSKEGDDEGGPSLTLVAAQAAGLPVVCTQFPGAEITVINNETGLYCLPENADSLYSKMAEMMDHKDWWNKMGKKGSDLVHNLFQKEKQMPILEDILLSSIKNHEING